MNGKIEVLYEDEHVLVIDKPSGIVSNRATTVETETIQDWMDARYDIKHQSYDDYYRERSGLVHRLDKETTGVMVLAKTEGSMLELMRQFKEREVEKRYIALTHGVWKVKTGTIERPIGRERRDRKKFGVRDDGKIAVTEYKVVREWRKVEFPPALGVDSRGYSGFSLVEFYPKSGRTHQIRVHSKHEGHPVVGDYIYAGRKRSREDRKWSERVMLSANVIEFTHPSSGERISVESKNRDIEKVIEKHLRE